MKAKVERLWTTNRGDKPTEINARYGGDSVGYPFAVDPSGKRLFLCNEKHLLFFHVEQNALTLSRVLSRNEGDWWCVGCSENELVALHTTFREDRTSLVWMDFEAKKQQWIRVDGVSSPPDQMLLTPKGTVILLDPVDYRGKEIDRNGRTVREYIAPYGMAIDPQGTIVIPLPKWCTERSQPPGVRIEETHEEHLIGIDNQYRLFWLFSDYQYDLFRPYFAYRVRGSAGTAVLNGPRADIRFLREPSHIEHVAIDKLGHVYVFGWRWRGSRSTVGIWRLTLRG